MSQKSEDTNELIASISKKVSEIIHKGLENIDHYEMIYIVLTIMATTLKAFIKVQSVNNKEPFSQSHVEHLLFAEFLKKYFTISSMCDSINHKETTNEKTGNCNKEKC